MWKIRKGSFLKKGDIFGYTKKKEEEETRGRRRGEERRKANHNYVLSLSSAELGRNLHLARITERDGERESQDRRWANNRRGRKPERRNQWKENGVRERTFEDGKRENKGETTAEVGGRDALIMECSRSLQIVTITYNYRTRSRPKPYDSTEFKHINSDRRGEEGRRRREEGKKGERAARKSTKKDRRE